MGVSEDALDLSGRAVNLDNILGVCLICLFIAAFLFGMSSSQAYMYFDRFSDDPLSIKALVAVVWTLDTFQTALMSHTVYYYTISRFNDYSSFHQKPVFSFNLEVVVVPLTAMIVQLWFAYQAWAVDRKSMPLAITIGLIAFLQMGFGFACSIYAFTQLANFADLARYQWLLLTWLALSGFGDLLVTISLIWTFYTSKTTFTDEDGFGTRFLMYGVHTGFFTSLTSIVDIILLAAWPGNLAFTGLNWILGKLYTNTLLYAINRRPEVNLRNQRADGTRTSQANVQPHGTGTSFPEYSLPPRDLRESGSQLEVKAEVKTEYDVDDRERRRTEEVAFPIAADQESFWSHTSDIAVSHG